MPPTPPQTTPPPATPEETSRMLLLAEESGEVVQAVMKCLRFGGDSVDPKLPEEEAVTNRVHLEHEIGDFIAHAFALADAGYISREAIALRYMEKASKPLQVFARQ